MDHAGSRNLREKRSEAKEQLRNKEDLSLPWGGGNLEQGTDLRTIYELKVTVHKSI